MRRGECCGWLPGRCPTVLSGRRREVQRAKPDAVHCLDEPEGMRVSAATAETVGVELVGVVEDLPAAGEGAAGAGPRHRRDRVHHRARGTDLRAGPVRSGARGRSRSGSGVGGVGVALRPRDGAPGSRRLRLRRIGRAASASSGRGRAPGMRVEVPQRASLLGGLRALTASSAGSEGADQRRDPDRRGADAVAECEQLALDPPVASSCSPAPSAPPVRR
jgi:hypothetical protein